MARRTYQISFPGTAFESITVTNAAAIGLTAATLAGKRGAFITCETNTVRFRWDGTDPTTAVGHIMDDRGYIQIMDKTTLENIRFIATGANATLRVTFH